MKTNLVIILIICACIVTTSRADTLTLSHYAPTNITHTSAWISVSLVSTGSANPEIFLFWDTQNHGSATTWAHTNSFGSNLPVGIYSTNLTNLSQDTLYYYRFYATNSSEHAWSDYTLAFKTLPVATNLPPSSAQTVMADITTGTLLSPLNFFTANNVLTNADDLTNAIAAVSDTALGVGAGATGLVYAVSAALSNETVIGATITAGAVDSVVTNGRMLEITWNTNAVDSSGVVDLSQWSDYPASNMISHWISTSISTVTNIGYARLENYYGDNWNYYENEGYGFMNFYQNIEPAQSTNITSGVFTVHPHPRNIPADNINITGISWPSVYDDWGGDFWSVWSVQSSAYDTNYDEVSGYYVLSVWFNLGGADSDVKSVTNELDYSEPDYLSTFGGSNDTWGLDLSDVASSDLSNLTFYVEVEFFTDAPASDFLFDLSGWSSLDFTTPEYTRIWYQLDTLEEQKFGIDTNGVFKVEENGETKIPLYTTDIGNLYQPYQPYSSEYVITNNDTFYIDFYDGSLVKIMVSNETATIAFGNANYSWNGVNRVGVELWAGTNSIAFDTATITNEVEFEINENGPTSLFFRRTEQEKWRGRQ